LGGGAGVIVRRHPTGRTSLPVLQAAEPAAAPAFGAAGLGTAQVAVQVQVAAAIGAARIRQRRRLA